jgi:hypothetical protein
MSRSSITASLEEFARSGRLGPIALGLTRREVSETLGSPTNWLNGKPVGQSAIWKYGDVEVYFDDEDRVHLIHFDWFKVPAGGPTLQLSPWVIRQGLPLNELEGALRTAGIPFDTHPDKSNPECVTVVTSAGVSFLVQVDGDADELGLCQFSRSAA